MINSTLAEVLSMQGMDLVHQLIYVIFAIIMYLAPGYSIVKTLEHLYRKSPKPLHFNGISNILLLSYALSIFINILFMIICITIKYYLNLEMSLLKGLCYVYIFTCLGIALYYMSLSSFDKAPQRAKGLIFFSRSLMKKYIITVVIIALSIRCFIFIPFR